MAWTMSEADIRQADPTNLSRLAMFLGCHPGVPSLEALQDAVMDHCDVHRHKCVFAPSWLAEYRICWGCGEVKTEEEYQEAASRL